MIPFLITSTNISVQFPLASGSGRNLLFPVVSVPLILTGTNGLYKPTGKRHLQAATKSYLV
jgi:hypothetical protein